MSTNSSIRDTFFEECQDLLEALDEGLNQINDGERDPEVINAVFRAVHSIKGGAGAFGLNELVEFAHTFETVFDEVRSGKLTLDDTLIRVLVRAADHLVELVEAARDGHESDEDVRNAILGELGGYLDDTSDEVVEFEPMSLGIGLDLPAADAAATTMRIHFKPHPGLYRNGHEPLFLLRSLSELGDANVSLDTSGLAGFSDLDPETPYLAWDIVLETEKSDNAIHDVFDFVEGLCDLKIEQDLGTTAQDQDNEDPTQPARSELPALTGGPDTAILAGSEPAKNAPGKDTKAEKSSDDAKSKAPAPSLRVDPDRVDSLINTVGELIINQSMLAQRVSELTTEQRREIEGDLEDYKLLARDIQEGVMAIRAQPVKPLFRRMARIAREAAHATGKLVQFETSGESTEVDKTVIEGLVDPLTHMIRNAVDHGVEHPEQRTKAGKSETGVIHISAAHRSGSVYIEIQDDGAGLNRQKIHSIAISKGLVSANQELSDGEIDNLLFLPGFSTATEVSNLSGRGVGMDVVKNAVTALGGRVSIASVPGEGTTFSIVLPLTLAVMDGMVVTVANQTMVVPISSIVETIRANKSDVHRLDASERLLSIRGTFVPVVDVAARLGLAPGKLSQEEVFLLVETATSGQTALSVDGIHDQRQVVVKSLEAAYGRVPGISAATILGDGKIAMILDPESIAQTTGSGKAFDFHSPASAEFLNASEKFHVQHT